MPMLYLNVRHTLPMIGMRVQRNTLDSSINQPRYEQETQTARSNRGVTQPKLTINSYPSRHSYGYTNNTDFARENYERGMSEVQKGTSKHTQMAWALVEDGSKQGRQVGIEFAKRDMENRVTRQRQLVAAAIPDPEIHFDVGQAVGEPTIGRTTPRWNTEGQARVQFNRGSIETYLQQKGDIHRWVSEGKYDIYA
ncbi:hypothetical protein HMPREF1148_0360 [Selenomonas sp. FOBRC6]|uniref:DUF6470 family protein n=1 Tax=Selenomonas sp. FOBRC6 TaxID=936572 RepID=UPI0002781A25|nr:DUF6470 family protein [Selenomonas sp. FOBRC6]EJO19792.1 hypothetical protein HMPREF1148_0360 [Selenomonas sp. FOBRC6]